jgi:hypothetical protein
MFRFKIQLVFESLNRFQETLEMLMTCSLFIVIYGRTKNNNS